MHACRSHTHTCEKGCLTLRLQLSPILVVLLRGNSAGYVHQMGQEVVGIAALQILFHKPATCTKSNDENEGNAKNRNPHLPSPSSSLQAIMGMGGHGSAAMIMALISRMLSLCQPDAGVLVLTTAEAFLPCSSVPLSSFSAAIDPAVGVMVLTTAEAFLPCSSVPLSSFSAALDPADDESESIASPLDDGSNSKLSLLGICSGGTVQRQVASAGIVWLMVYNGLKG